MSRRWTNELLDLLRLVADPIVDEWVISDGFDRGNLPRPPEEKAATKWKSDAGSNGRLGRADRYWRTVDSWEQSLERADADLASDLFVRFGQEIGAALLLASLPQSYAAESGAAVLARSEALLRRDGRPGTLTRRIGRTAQFLLDVMLEPSVGPEHPIAKHHAAPGYPVDPRLALLPGGRGFTAARETRLIHAVIRQHVRGGWDPTARIGRLLAGEPINQEHLLGTYLSFTVTVWTSLERMGIRWSDTERQAYLNHWNWVADLMGIGERATIDRGARNLDADTQERLERCLEAFGDGPVASEYAEGGARAPHVDPRPELAIGRGGQRLPERLRQAAGPGVAGRAGGRDARWAPTVAAHRHAVSGRHTRVRRPRIGRRRPPAFARQLGPGTESRLEPRQGEPSGGSRHARSSQPGESALVRAVHAAARRAGRVPGEGGCTSR